MNYFPHLYLAVALIFLFILSHPLLSGLPFVDLRFDIYSLPRFQISRIARA